MLLIHQLEIMLIVKVKIKIRLKILNFLTSMIIIMRRKLLIIKNWTLLFVVTVINFIKFK